MFEKTAVFQNALSLELKKTIKSLNQLVRFRSNIEIDGLDRLIARDNDIEEKFAAQGD